MNEQVRGMAAGVKIKSQMMWEVRSAGEMKIRSHQIKYA
jgi:hypothetical protein